MSHQFLLQSKKKPLSKEAQLTNKKIGNLIGFGLYRLDYLKDFEVDFFRRKMTEVRMKELEQRNDFNYTFQPDLASDPPSVSIIEKLGNGKIQFRLHYPSDNIIKTLTCSVEDSPNQLIAQVFPKFKLNLPPDSQPEEYGLKVCGMVEYLVGSEPLIRFNYIRRCLLKDEKMNFILFRLRDVPFSSIMSMEELNKIEDSNAGLGSHKELTIEGKGEDELKMVSLWGIAKNFRLQITACENLNVGSIESIYCEVGIYHGGILLCPMLRTHQITACRHPRWGAWLNFDITYYNLPKTARLCITVWGRWNAKKKMTTDTENDLYPLGWVNVLLMDYRGQLKNGLIKVNLWPNEKANPIGTTVALQNNDEASIFLKFTSFAHPVFYPNEIYREKEVPDPPPFNNELIELKLKKIIYSDPLTILLDQETKEQLWKYRYHFVQIPEALPKVLLSARWHILQDVIEVKQLLLVWKPPQPEDALILLDAYFSDSDVRAYAVKQLEKLNDSEVLDFLLQLVQALKYEPYLDCALARFLLKLALRNKIVGHHFFWYLRSEMEDPTVSLRFALLLEAYLRGCGLIMEDLIKQNEVLCKLQDINMVIKKCRNDQERKEALQLELQKVIFPPQFQLAVLGPKMECSGILIDKCKYKDSKKLPLWCVFENADPTGSDVYVIFKVGDDLRQDMLTLQMIKIMDKLWQNENLDLRMLPYGCLSTGNGVGMIEVVLNAETVSNIQLAFGGSSAAFRDQPIDEWLRKQNPDEKDYEKAVETFTLSCAGYCVATYVLGIGDRHNDNIMVTKYGHLFHIDFGHFLGNIKRKFGIKRERAPFVLTPDFVYVMGKREGKEHAQFKKFIDYCLKAYLILRKKSNMFINLFAMMLSTGIPELKSVEDLSYLRESLCLDKTEEEAVLEFRGLIFESLRLGWSTQLNWWLHNLVHSK